MTDKNKLKFLRNFGLVNSLLFIICAMALCIYYLVESKALIDMIDEIEITTSLIKACLFPPFIIGLWIVLILSAILDKVFANKISDVKASNYNL